MDNPWYRNSYQRPNDKLKKKFMLGVCGKKLAKEEKEKRTSRQKAGISSLPTTYSQSCAGTPEEGPGFR